MFNRIDLSKINQPMPLALITKAMQLVIDLSFEEGPAQNLLFVSRFGCGKTATTREALKNLYGYKGNDIYKINGIDTAVVELHGASLQVDTIMVPRIRQGCLEYVFNTFFEKKVFKAGRAIILIQDVNKNEDPYFVSFLKTLVDQRAGDRELPPSRIIMTANSPSEKYVTTPMDMPILSTATILHVEPTKEEVIKWSTRGFLQTEKIFKERNSFFPEREHNILVNEKCERNWDALNHLLAYISKHPEYEELVPYIVPGRVGAETGQAYITELLSISEESLDYTELWNNKSKLLKLCEDPKFDFKELISSTDASFKDYKWLVQNIKSKTIQKTLLVLLYNTPKTIELIQTNNEDLEMSRMYYRIQQGLEF